MDTGSFWLWTVFFAMMCYLFVQTICICCFRDSRRNAYLPLVQSDRKDSDESTNIDYVDYFSIVSTKRESIN